MHGFRETLSSLQPPIIFEVLPNFEGPNRVPVEKPMAAKRSEAANEIYSFLSSIGYRIYLIDERGDEILIDRFELDDPASFIGTNWRNGP